MRAFCRFTLLVLGTGGVLMEALLAQSPPGLFVAMAPELSASAIEQGAARSPAVVLRSTVGMLLDQVFSGAGAPAPSLRLNVERHDWVARFQRVDVDNITGFRSWVGRIDGIDRSHVVITERDGVVSGLINAVDLTYRIRTVAPGVYFLEQVDTRQLGVEGEPLPGAATIGPARDLSVADDGTTIDVLMLYTPAAETAAGGGAQILSIVSQIISDTNTIFSNSGIAPRVRLVGASTMAIIESATLNGDLTTLTYSPAAQGMRDAFGADLVHLLVDSPDPNQTGLAWLFRTPGAADFTAYSIASVESVAAYTPTHEMGHNLGAHHAPEDGAVGGLFPYSLGYKDPVQGFRTIMAYDCPAPGCPRVAHMSSATVLFQGRATGKARQDNALSINSAAFTIANWRPAVTEPDIPPPPPTNLQTQVSGTTVAFQWGLSAGATGYTFQIGSAPGLANVVDVQIGQVFGGELTLGLGTYYWRVIATNAHGASASAEAQFSITTTCPVSTPPRNLVASVNGGHVMLVWSSPTLGAVSTYIVEAGSSSGGTDLFDAPVGPQTTVQAFVPAGGYFVRVRAGNVCGNSAASNEVFFSAGSVSDLPAQPQNLRLTLTTTLATADWDIGPGLVPPEAFIIEAGSAPGLADQAVIEVSGQTLSFTTTRPAPGSYYVRIRARNGPTVGPATPDLLLVVP